MVDSTASGQISNLCSLTREHTGFTEWEILQSERENFQEVTGNKDILLHMKSIAFACLKVENHQMAEEAGVVNMALRFIAKGICVHDAAKILFNMRGNISAMNKVQQFGKVGELLKSIKIAEAEIVGPSNGMRRYGIYYEFKQVLFHAYGEIFQIAKESREDPNFE